MDPIYFLRDASVPDALEKWVMLQKDLDLLNDESLPQVIQKVIDKFSNEYLLVYQHISMFHDIRPVKSHLYVAILKSLIENNCLSAERIISEGIALDHPLLAFRLMELGILDPKKITKFNLEFTFLYQSKISRFIVNLPEFKYRNLSERREIFQEIIQYGYRKDTAKYAVKYDEVDLLIKLSAERGFDYNRQVFVNPYDLKKPDECGHKKIPILALAAFYGSIKCFKFLLLNKAKVDNTVCEFATRGGNTDIIHLCEHEGGNFSHCVDLAVEYHHNSVVDWLLLSIKYASFSLMTASKANNIKAILFMLQSSSIELMSKHYMGITALHYVCLKGYSNIVSLFLQCGADVNCKTDGNYYYRGKTPIHFAAEGGDVSTIKILVEHGADIHARTGGETPLGAAALNGMTDACQLFLELGVDINALNSSVLSSDGKMTALHNACMNGHTEVVKLLLEKGANTEIKSSMGKLPIDYANKEEIKKLLMESA